MSHQHICKARQHELTGRGSLLPTSRGYAGKVCFVPPVLRGRGATTNVPRINEERKWLRGVAIIVEPYPGVITINAAASVHDGSCNPIPFVRLNVLANPRHRSVCGLASCHRHGVRPQELCVVRRGHACRGRLRCWVINQEAGEPCQHPGCLVRPLVSWQVHVE